MDAVWAEGEGERDTIPDAIPGFPIARNTVSRVRSTFLSDLVRISCFLIRNK